jgi:hypothetical protein
MAFRRSATIALLAAALAGCGGSGKDTPKPVPSRSDDAAIRDAVMRSYTSTDTRDCTRVFTTAFVQAAYQGVAGCAKHMREKAGAPVALRESVRFRPIAGIGPRMNFSVTVVRVVANGHARNGVRSATAPLVDDFGTVTNQRVRYRVVNVLVRLRNHGPAPFRGTVSAFVVGTGGRTWPAARHAGRRPDWTDGERRGIAPGRSVTRWVTVAMPAAGRPRAVELRPEVLSGPNTVTAVEPDRARWRAR